MIIWSKFHKITLAEQKMRRAQLYRDQKMMEQAQNMPRPNCNRLNELTGGWSKCNLFKKLHVVNFMFKKPVCSALFFKLLYVKKNYLFYKYLPWEFYGKSVCQTNFIFFHFSESSSLNVCLQTKKNIFKNFNHLRHLVC